VHPDTDAFRARFGLALTPVGRVISGRGVSVEGDDGRVDLPRGHDHLT
jgi:hypothetical protein